MSRLFLSLSVLLLLIPLSYALVFPKEILFFDKLVANDEQTKLINNNEILFTSIGVTVSKDVTRAKITVQAMPDCPENAPYQENVLQCFYISTNFDADEISNAEIEFKVPKTWINENNFDKNALQLRRYSYSWNGNDGKLSNWKTLTTNLEGEEDDHYLYSADSDGFSYFSIAGIEKINQEPQITAQVIQESPKTIEILEENITKTNSNILFYVLLLSFISIGISFMPALLQRKKERTPFEQLTTYIKENQTSNNEELKQDLKGAGWQDWQINLAFNEVKKL